MKSSPVGAAYFAPTELDLFGSFILQICQPYRAFRSRCRRGGRGRRGWGGRQHGVVEGIDHAPAFAFGAAAAVVRVFAVEIFHGVAHVHGQRERIGIEQAQRLARMVGDHLRLVAVARGGLELRQQRAHFGGAGHGHRHKAAGGGIHFQAAVHGQPAIHRQGGSRRCGGLPGGFAGDDEFRRFGNVIMRSHRRDGGGGGGTFVIIPVARGKESARHSIVQRLMEMGAEHLEPVGNRREPAGGGGLRGERAVHGAIGRDQTIQQAGGYGVVDLRPLVGVDGMVGGHGAFPLVARGFEGA